jgi:uroporphyrinogen-III synthase
MSDVVVVTAAEGSFPGLIPALRAIPALVEEHPLIAFEPPLEWGPVDAAVRDLSRFDALAVTSPRAAAAFRQRATVGVPNTVPAVMPPLWAAGSGTAAALGEALAPVRTPSDRSVRELGAAGALARAMLTAGVRGPVLFPCGDLRRDELPARLRAGGVEVLEAVCYRSVLAGELAARRAAKRARILVVASPSVADLLVRACPEGDRPSLLAVGPTTAATARASGWVPAAVASTPTVEALVAGVRELLS